MTKRKNNQTNLLIKWAVIVGDFLLLNALLTLFYKTYPGVSVWNTDKTEIFWVICNAAMMLAQWKFSTIIHLRLISGGDILRRVIGLTSVQTVTAYLMMKATNNTAPVGWMLIQMGILQTGIMTFLRFLERKAVKEFRQAGRNTRTVTFIGDDPELITLYRMLAKNPTLGYHVNGYYADNELNTENNGKQDIGIERLGTLQVLMAAIDENQELDLGDEVYACLPRRERKTLWALSDYCDMHVTRFYYVPASVERLGMKLKREFFDDMELFTTHEVPLEDPVNKFGKRLFDIITALIVLICSLPFYLIVALIIKLQSPGPFFFKQERTGLSGNQFVCYKFRSMHTNKDADKLQATQNDPRKFPFGSFMRKYNIDELPQFWNVLKGDMSIVGPRPHMLLHTEIYSQQIGKYMVRHFVKPGITGWAQVTGFRGETKELWQMEERVRRDIWYIENWSIWLDIRIIWITAKNIFIHDKNAY